MKQLVAQLQENQIDYTLQEPMAKHTSFRIGGPAAVYCCPGDAIQMAKILGLCRENGIRYYLLGKGSNVLFGDDGFDGVVISTLGITGGIRQQGDSLIAGAGVSLNALCRFALDNGLTGMEFAYGIPGSLGGAVYMNAGAYGGEMKDVLETVTYLNEKGQICTAPAGLLELGYRTSIFERKDWCILAASIRLQAGKRDEIETKMEDLLGRRKEKQPLEFPSAGSTFKRPEGAFAGALIEQCGLRGYQVGGAAISQKHCGFVVNLGGATCRDVLSLCARVSERVQQQTGYVLEQEIRIVE